MLHVLTKHFATHVQTTESSIKNLEKQVGQMAEAITRNEARSSGNLPSQTVVNPKENVSALTLRSGRQVQPKPALVPKEISSDVNPPPRLDIPPPRLDNPPLRLDDSAPAVPSTESPPLRMNEPAPADKASENSAEEDSYVLPNFSPLYAEKPPAPFPEALRERRVIEDNDLFETFSKCEVNIPLLKLVKSIPKYARFLKELCTVKRNQKLKGKQKVQVSEVSMSLRSSNDGCPRNVVIPAW